MRLTLIRLLLDPRTSWRALRMRREPAADGLPFDAIWRQARMFSAPDEMVYRMHGHRFPVGQEEEQGKEDGLAGPQAGAPGPR
ncbi:hypothetical protein [Streptomyces sp. NPDC058579]|uniref:hypothetical protein n=1 Tax=Streptomyces sp. NPDC058579 TaxID=3346548 RepID=UPI00364A0EEA